MIFKKLGKAPNVPREIKERSKLSQDEWNEYFYGHWSFSGEKQDKHRAPFPEELPKRLIKMFSFVGDTVLDPFLGSGTTSLIALKLLRNSIGYEINEEYLSTIRKRLMKNIGFFQQKEKIEIIKQQREDIDFTKEIGNLPYIFEDKVSFERKVDPKLLRFGSRINGKEKDNERYYTVKKILSPSEILLDTGAKIHLIGIKPNGKKSTECIQFLENLARGQKVFLKFGEVKHDENNNLLCYLYLKNKTFVNVHLIKSGLVDVDITSEYEMKNKFVSLFAQSGRKNEGKNWLIT